MNKGGYQILDLNGTVFDDGKDYAIDGIFNKISETRKPILITNFTLNASDYLKMRDVFAMFTLITDEETHEKHYVAEFDLPEVGGLASPAYIKVIQNDNVEILFY